MGSSKSKPQQRQNTKGGSHCCLDECLHPIKSTTKLHHVLDLHWQFTKKHEKQLKQFLRPYKLEDIVVVIMDYLENYTFSQESANYRAFIRTSLSLLSDAPHKQQVCNIGYNKVVEDYTRWEHSTGSRNAIKCVMLGAGAVGKSSLTMGFTHGIYTDEYDPTMEDSYCVQFPLNVDKQDIDKHINSQHCDDQFSRYSNRQHIAVDILDTAGREEFSALIDHWFRNGQLFFLVFDVMSQVTFDEIVRIVDRILRVKEGETDFGIVCVGNKCDLRGDPNYTPTTWGYRGPVDMKKAMKWFEEQQLPYVETSAKTGQNANFLLRHSIFEYWIQSQSGHWQLFA